jgi:hypothetical protein
MLTSRERLLTALHNQQPDHLPCQVHSWMTYYLDHYLGGCDQYAAYAHFPGMDWVIYVAPEFAYDPHDLADWQVETRHHGRDRDGNERWDEIIHTPGGDLPQSLARYVYTSWTTEFLIKSPADFELWERYLPLPAAVDWSPVAAAKARIGERGIVRSGFFGFGQGSPGRFSAPSMTPRPPSWPPLTIPTGSTTCCGPCSTKRCRSSRGRPLRVGPGGDRRRRRLVHGHQPRSAPHFLPALRRIQHEALHAAGTRVVYHLCGGLMPLLETVATNGADGLETMTPPGMGGDCDLAEANRRVGERLFFIGGFDRTPASSAALPRRLPSWCAVPRRLPPGGYICSPSDHFFFGDPPTCRPLWIRPTAAPTADPPLRQRAHSRVGVRVTVAVRVAVGVNVGVERQGRRRRGRGPDVGHTASHQGQKGAQGGVTHRIDVGLAGGRVGPAYHRQGVGIEVSDSGRRRRHRRCR